MKPAIIYSFLMLFFFLYSLSGARLILEGDRILEGIIIEDNEQNYRLITPYSVITIPADRVKEAQKEPYTKSIEKMLTSFTAKEEYQTALNFLQLCLDENVFGLAEYYKYSNTIRLEKHQKEFENKLTAYYEKEDYKSLINLVRSHSSAYPQHKLSEHLKDKLITAYTQMSFYYIDHIQYEKGYKYLNQAFQLSKDAPSVREILVLYAERTGNTFIKEREAEYDDQIASYKPVTRTIPLPHKEPLKIAEPEEQHEDLLVLMLQAYNAGPATLLAYQGNVQYQETRQYIQRVKNNMNNSDLNTPHDDLIHQFAKKYQLEPRFVKAVLLAESSGRCQAVSSQGARGLMQIMEGTWKDMAQYIGVQWSYREAFEPAKNIEIGCAYFAWLRDDFLPLFFSIP